MKLVLFILIMDGHASKEHKRMEQKVLNQSLKGLVDFKAYFLCVALVILTKFSVNPYYEPLLRFMIVPVNWPRTFNLYWLVPLRQRLELIREVPCS